MELDRTLLAEHASHTLDGVTERALTFEVDGESCFGLLYTPADRPAGDLGFVVCHSYALEVLNLRRIERAVARALARLGHPVLAFHRRGYGDSTGLLDDASLEWHLRDTRVAAETLARETGTTRLGYVGGKFGGLIASLAARDGSAERLILMNPALTGEGYFRRMMKEMALVQLSIRDETPRKTTEDMLAELESTGMVDVLGFPIHRALYAPIKDEDLAADMGSFSGEALLFQVSKRSGTGKDTQALADRLQADGATVRVEALREPAGTTFGGVAYVSTGDPMTREDVMAPVLEGIVTVTEDWIGA
ncbi:MAG: alpha/beta fold hydrolase [Actinomycetota bacterium]